MQHSLRSTGLFASCLALSASAQTATLVHGHKVLVDKTGQIVPAPSVPSPTAPALPAAPLVGGADDCTTPDVLSGLGSFAFDNTLATTGAQGQSENACLTWSTTSITHDVWFTWVASFTGGLTVDTCTGTTADTRLAAYAGSTCPTAGSALACNDDACILESRITFAVTSGNAYVIQLGNFPGGVQGTGMFTLTMVPPPPPNDDCGTPTALPGPGTYPFDLTMATTSTQGQTTAGCGPALPFYKDLWYTYAATTNGTATITTCGFITPGSATNDTKIEVFAGAGCPANPAIICNDDDTACTAQALASTLSFATVCGQTYTIQLGQYAATANITGSIDISEAGTQCGPTGMPFCFGDGSGTACPCGNAGAAGNGCASSVNANGANLTTSGNSSLASDTLVLQGTGMPSSSCLYFQGTTQISAPFGAGLRCAGGTVNRLGTKTNVGGSSQYPATNDAPVSVKGAVTAPGTRTYQTWYRNAAAFCTPSTFNLTNGVLVTWQ
jgi:hypothetical protein